MRHVTCDMKRKGFQRLNVWQEGHEFAIMIYKATEKFPKEEKFGLTSQIRRAAFSVPANIVEGYAYGSNKKFLQKSNVLDWMECMLHVTCCMLRFERR